MRGLSGVTKEEGGMFKKTLSRDLIEKLNKETLFKQKLKHDIEKGKVFFSIRRNEVDFYYKGGRLFNFSKEGFKTHLKYASVFKSNDDYILESKLKDIQKIDSFVDGYARIKENCSRYSGIESAGVAHIYSGYSYVIPQSYGVVLDIEVSLKSLDKEKKQDRIDILFFDKKKKKLIFCEAKIFLNKEIWSPKGTSPKVVNQINRYEEQIKNKETDILEQYRNYIDNAKEIFPKIDLPYPDSINPKVLLMIFGYDKDQLLGKRFNELFKSNLPKSIMYYAKGDISSLKIESVFKKCN